MLLGPVAGRALEMMRPSGSVADFSCAASRRVAILNVSVCVRRVIYKEPVEEKRDWAVVQ